MYPIGYLKYINFVKKILKSSIIIYIIDNVTINIFLKIKVQQLKRYSSFERDIIYKQGTML